MDYVDQEFRRDVVGKARLIPIGQRRAGSMAEGGSVSRVDSTPRGQEFLDTYSAVRASRALLSAGPSALAEIRVPSWKAVQIPFN